MKNLRLILPLLLLLPMVTMDLPTVLAQTPQDTLRVAVTKNADLVWHFSFKHTGPNHLQVNRFVLTIDTVAYPFARFGNNTVSGQAANENWGFVSTSNSGDSAVWCNEYTFIAPGGKDSIFEFQLQPPLWNPNANLYDSTIVINWCSYFASNSCSTFQNVSCGSFTIIPTSFQCCQADTFTASVTTPGCDPLFNFNVRNQNNGSYSIDGVRFQILSAFEGVMRPSAIRAPSGWTLDSVTTESATFHTGAGSGIPSGGSLSGFRIGVRAPQAATAAGFVMTTFSGGAMIARDTVFSIPMTPPACSEDPSNDTVVVTNAGTCHFVANLENFHTGQGYHLVTSRITKLVMSVTTPGVTFESGLVPNAPNPNWSLVGQGTQTLTWTTPSTNYGVPGGIIWAFPFVLNNPTPAQPVQIQWQTFSDTTSNTSGSVTVACAVPGPKDTVIMKPSAMCEDTLIVKNRHTPTAGVQSITVQSLTPGWTFSSAAGTLKGPAHWESSVANGLSFFNTGGSQYDLPTGQNDTFYFAVIPPAHPTTTYQLEVKTYESVTHNIKVDTTISSIPACTPPIVCDSASDLPNTAACEDTFTIYNRRLTENIDSIVVTPQDGWIIRSANAIAFNWHANVTPTRATFSGGTIVPNVPQGGFIVGFNDGPQHNFHATVQSYAGGVACSATFPETCQNLAVNSIAPDALAFTVAPNPLNSRSDITFTTSDFDRVDLVLMDVLGRTVQSVFSGMLGSGNHTFTLDGSSLPAGTYYLRLEVNGTRLTKKVIIER